jgi:hypothetical protein
MSEEIREMIDKVKNFKSFVNENVKTNLTPDLYSLVRSENFKKWFGDWENDKENSSKVLDENGEPLLVYHGSIGNEFSEFDINKTKDGIHFGNIKQAKHFSDMKDGKLYKAFLNIRNLGIGYDIENKQATLINQLRKDGVEWNKSIEIASEKINYKQQLNGFDGIKYWNTVEGDGFSYVVFDTSKIYLIN